MNKFISPFIVIALFLGGCAPRTGQIKLLDDYRMPTEVVEPSALTQTVEAGIAARIPPRECPVTVAGKSTFTALPPYSSSAPWEGIFWFGSEGLWTALDNNGVWWGLPLNPDGYTQKIMWWSTFYSLPDEPEPALVVSGRRLDGESPTLRFYGATNAMADDIGEAMLTGVEFTTLGCWEVRGEYKKTSLTFVVWIAP